MSLTIVFSLMAAIMLFGAAGRGAVREEGLRVIGLYASRCCCGWNVSAILYNGGTEPVEVTGVYVDGLAGDMDRVYGNMSRGAVVVEPGSRIVLSFFLLGSGECCIQEDTVYSVRLGGAMVEVSYPGLLRGYAGRRCRAVFRIRVSNASSPVNVSAYIAGYGGGAAIISPGSGTGDIVAPVIIPDTPGDYGYVLNITISAPGEHGVAHSIIRNITVAAEPAPPPFVEKRFIEGEVVRVEIRVGGGARYFAAIRLP